MRGALRGGVPLFVVTAPDARTGKTYLVNLIALIATGHIPVSVAGSRGDEEFEKRVETAALSCRPILHFNNLPNGMTVESERLSELATERKVTIRKLGRHEGGECDCRATTAFLNGNNILLIEDLVPRSITCRLDAGIERPETQKFDDDPMDKVLKDRGKYLAAAFTIIRAFAYRGEDGWTDPEERKHVAGFEPWEELIQKPLMWLGQPDPRGFMEAMRAQDPKQEQLLQLHKALRDAFETKAEREAITVAKCKEKADKISGQGPYGGRAIFENPVLRELMSVKGELNVRHFGHVLTGAIGKIRNGWVLRLAGEGKSNAYCFEPITEAAMAAEAEAKAATTAAAAADPPL